MTSCSFHQAILKYLRECLNDTEDGEVESSDSTDNNVFSKHTIPLQPIDNKFSLVASKSDIRYVYCESCNDNKLI